MNGIPDRVLIGSGSLFDDHVGSSYPSGSNAPNPANQLARPRRLRQPAESLISPNVATNNAWGLDQSADSSGVLLTIDLGPIKTTARLTHGAVVAIESSSQPFGMSLRLQPVGNGLSSIECEIQGKRTVIARDVRQEHLRSCIGAATLFASSITFILDRVSKRGESFHGTSDCDVPEGFVGYPHDDTCSASWLPHDTLGKHIGNLDISMCCKEMDRLLFCEKSRLELPRIASQFIWCIYDELIARLSYNLPWFMEWLFLPLWILVLTPLAEIAATLFSTVLLFIDERYLNLDGRNDDSCLCGGTKSTLKCNSDPNDKRNWLCGGLSTYCCKRLDGSIRRTDPYAPCETDPDGSLPACNCVDCCWEQIGDKDSLGVGLPTRRFERIKVPESYVIQDCCRGTPGGRFSADKINCP